MQTAADYRPVREVVEADVRKLPLITMQTTADYYANYG